MSDQNTDNESVEEVKAAEQSSEAQQEVRADEALTEQSNEQKKSGFMPHLGLLVLALLLWEVLRAFLGASSFLPLPAIISFGDQETAQAERSENPAQQQRIAAISAEISALATKLKQQEQSLAKDKAPQVQNQIEALNGRMAALDGQLQTQGQALLKLSAASKQRQEQLNKLGEQLAHLLDSSDDALRQDFLNFLALQGLSVQLQGHGDLQSLRSQIEQLRQSDKELSRLLQPLSNDVLAQTQSEQSLATRTLGLYELHLLQQKEQKLAQKSGLSQFFASWITIKNKASMAKEAALKKQLEDIAALILGQDFISALQQLAALNIKGEEADKLKQALTMRVQRQTVSLALDLWLIAKQQKLAAGQP